MSEKFPSFSSQSTPDQESSPAIEEELSASTETDTPPAENPALRTLSEANLTRLNWQADEVDGQAMLIAENIALPQWYQSEGFDETEHRRPAIMIRQREGQTFYCPAWAFFDTRHVFQPIAEVDRIEEAEAIMVKHQEMFLDTTNENDFQRRYEEMLNEDRSLRS